MNYKCLTPCLLILILPLLLSFQEKITVSNQSTTNFPSSVFPYTQTTPIDWSKIEVKLLASEKKKLFENADEETLNNINQYRQEVKDIVNSIHVLDLNADGENDFIYQGPYEVEDEIQVFIKSGNKYNKKWRSYIQINDPLDGIVKIEINKQFGLSTLYFRDANHYGPASELPFADYYHIVEFTSKDKSIFNENVFTKITCVELPLSVSMNKVVKPKNDQVKVNFSSNPNYKCPIYGDNKLPLIGYLNKNLSARIIANGNPIGAYYFGEFEMKYPIEKKLFKILGWVDAKDIIILEN